MSKNIYAEQIIKVQLGDEFVPLLTDEVSLILSETIEFGKVGFYRRTDRGEISRMCESTKVGEEQKEFVNYLNPFYVGEYFRAHDNFMILKAKNKVFSSLC